MLFNRTSSSNEGSYVVQMVMEDFPRQNITLTHTNGSQVTRTTSDAISKIPIQFAVKGKIVSFDSSDLKPQKSAVDSQMSISDLQPL